MPKIHELIAADSDRQQIANSLADEAVVTFAKKTDHFMGQTRRIEMFDEAREGENVEDVKEIVTTVEEKLDHVWDGLYRAYDVAATKENSNTSTEARANVIVAGTTVLENVPATVLLQLERELKKLKNLYAAIPTLDPAYAWEPDETAEKPGVFRVANDQVQLRTEKELDKKILYDATEHHPAQVETFTVDRPVGKIITTRISGAVTPARKAEWLRRISELATAVKEARQRANSAEAIEMTVGAQIRTFIHAPE